jgi:ABC-type Fe3+ transport system permease subunit
VRDLVVVLAAMCLVLGVISTLAFDGFVLDTKLEDGRYLILLRSGPQPAEWVETAALRYWYETLLNAIALGTVVAAVACAVLYVLKREWGREKESRTPDD